MHINATHIEADPDDGENFALLFMKGDDGNYLSLTRGTSEENDHGICLEIGDQSRSAFDAISHSVFSSSQFRLTLHAGKIDGIDGNEVVVSFAAPYLELELAEAALRNIFRGRESLIDGLTTGL